MFIDNGIHSMYDLNGMKVLEDCMFLFNYYRVQDAIKEYRAGKIADFQAIDAYRTFYDLGDLDYLTMCNSKYGGIHYHPDNMKQLMESMTSVEKFIQNDLDVDWPRVREIINVLQKVGTKNRQYP